MHTNWHYTSVAKLFNSSTKLNSYNLTGSLVDSITFINETHHSTAEEMLTQFL